MANPAAPQPPCATIAPVPLMVMWLATITKQELPLLDLLTMPLNVTFECGRYTSPVRSHVGLLPAAETLTPFVRLGSWYSATPDQGPEVGALMSRVPPVPPPVFV